LFSPDAWDNPVPRFSRPEAQNNPAKFEKDLIKEISELANFIFLKIGGWCQLWTVWLKLAKKTCALFGMNG